MLHTDCETPKIVCTVQKATRRYSLFFLFLSIAFVEQSKRVFPVEFVGSSFISWFLTEIIYLDIHAFRTPREREERDVDDIGANLNVLDSIVFLIFVYMYPRCRAATGGKLLCTRRDMLYIKMRGTSSRNGSKELISVRNLK